MYRKIVIIFILLVSLAAYGLTLKAIPGNITSSSPELAPPFNGSIPPFELSGSRSAFATMLALKENGRFDLTVPLADFAAPDTGFYRGKIFSFFPPAVAVFALPFYELGENFNYSLAAAFFSISILSALTLVVLFKICVDIFKLPVWASLFAVFITAFASHYLNFSISLYQQIPSAFVMLFSFYAAWKYKESSRFSWIWACLVWLTYGIASFINYPNIILLFPIILYFVYSGTTFTANTGKLGIKFRKSLLITSILMIGVVGLHIYYNQHNFGHWKRFSNTLAQYDAQQEGKSYEELVAKNDSVEELVEKKEKVSSNFLEQRFIKGIYVLLFDINKSLLVHAPFFLFGILGLFMIRKRLNLEHFTIMGLILLNIIVYSSFFDPWGGWSFGPRYIVPSVPLFAIFFAYWISAGRLSLVRRIIGLLLFAYGVGVALVGAVGRSVIAPKEHVVGLDVPVLFVDVYKFIEAGWNGTFIFNQFFRGKIELMEYYYILLGALTFVAFVTLFIVPVFDKRRIDFSNGISEITKENNDPTPTVVRKDKVRRIEV